MLQSLPLPWGVSIPGVPAARPASLTLRFDANAASAPLSDYTLQVIASLLACAGVEAADISSTARDAHDQARAMFDNLEARGADSELRLYGAAGRAVIETYRAAKHAGLDGHHVRQAMVDAIVAQGKANVSHHCGDFSALQVVDIDPAAMPLAARPLFELAACSHLGATLSRFLAPPVDCSYHLEVPQPAPDRGMLASRGLAEPLHRDPMGNTLAPLRHVLRIDPRLIRLVSDSEYRRLFPPAPRRVHHAHHRRKHRRR